MRSPPCNPSGDVACQLLIDNDRPFSVRRLFNMSLLGAVLVAPCLHVWYDLLAEAAGVGVLRVRTARV